MNHGNTRGLEHIADGTFGGAVFNLGANAATPQQGTTIINLTMKDGVPRPVTVTLVSPLPLTPLGSIGPPFYAQHGSPSIQVEWGSGGYNSTAIIDGREGDTFTLSCSFLKVTVFNDALEMGYNPASLVDGVQCPINFGAFASLGRAVNRQGFLKRTKMILTPILPGASGLVNLPKYATSVKIYRNPILADLDVYHGNTFGNPALPTSTGFEVDAGEDCPVVELGVDSNQVGVENGAVQIDKLVFVFDLAL